MPSKINVYMLDEMRSRFAGVEHCIVVRYSGVTSAEMTDLRATIRKDKASMVVMKNTLAARAFQEMGRGDDFTQFLDGPVAVVYGDDPAAAVRSMTDWDKKKKKLQIVGGMVGGRAIAKEQVAYLATLPPLPVMRAMALGAVAAPLTSLLSVCNEVVRSFMRATEKLAEKKAEAGQ